MATKGILSGRKCLWRLKKATYGLRQAPKLWQEHFAEVMTTKLGFRRCKSDPNLYCHESGQLYVLAYVDDLLVVIVHVSTVRGSVAERDWPVDARK